MRVGLKSLGEVCFRRAYVLLFWPGLGGIGWMGFYRYIYMHIHDTCLPHAANSAMIICLVFIKGSPWIFTLISTFGGTGIQPPYALTCQREGQTARPFPTIWNDMQYDGLGVWEFPNIWLPRHSISDVYIYIIWYMIYEPMKYSIEILLYIYTQITVIQHDIYNHFWWWCIYLYIYKYIQIDSFN